jgi:hypothetical protein
MSGQRTDDERLLNLRDPRNLQIMIKNVGVIEGQYLDVLILFICLIVLSITRCPKTPNVCFPSFPPLAMPFLLRTYQNDQQALLHSSSKDRRMLIAVASEQTHPATLRLVEACNPEMILTGGTPLNRRAAARLVQLCNLESHSLANWCNISLQETFWETPPKFRRLLSQ